MFRNYADYEVPLLQVLADLPGGQGASREVRDRFGERFSDRIPEEHLVYLENAREAKWRNIVAWVRNGLIGRGLMDSPAYGVWRITDAGRAFLEQVGQPAGLADATVSAHRRRVSDRSIVVPAKGSRAKHPQGELTKAEFIERARAELEQLLADLGQGVTLLVQRDRLVQVHLRDFSGCHYELWVHGDSIEVGLHFESSQKLNYARLAAFAPHQDALDNALGEHVRVEKWGQGLARVFCELPRPALTVTLADEHAARLQRLISATLPILREAYAGRAKRPRVEAHVETPARVHAIVDTQVAAMRDFLHGRASRPSDERLCDWVHLCYELELYREGQELFRLIDPAQVNDWYYERAKRLARVCAMKTSGQV